MQQTNKTGRPPLTDEERVLLRTRALLENRKARGWSHAVDLAADTLPSAATTPTERRRSRRAPRQEEQS